MKVLIVRFSSIGDIVLTTPVIRAVKQQTGAEVHFLTKSVWAGTLVKNPYLDKLWTIKRGIAEIAEALIAENYTHLIDLHGNLRTLELKQRLRLGHWMGGRRAPRSSTFAKLNFRKFLLTRFGLNRMPDVHIVDRYLATARSLGVKADGLGLEYFIDVKDEVDLPAHHLPIEYVALVIGAAHATKRLEAEQLIEFCQRLSYPIVLLGGPAEAATGAAIAAAGGAHVHNACGAFPLNSSADLVRRARLVVTHDTGLMHIAAAFRKPILSVWGNTVPALGMYPYLPEQAAREKEWRWEVRGLPCRPCSKIGYQACPKGHFRCMRDQDVPGLAQAASRIINELR